MREGSSRVRALITDPGMLSSLAPAWRRLHPELADRVEFVLPESTAADALTDVGEGCEVIFGCRTVIDAPLLGRLPAARLILQCAAGYDNIDVAAASARGVVVARVLGSGVTAVAEHTLMLMLALARRLPWADAETHAGRWRLSELAGALWELRGKVCGIVGMGAIGREVGRLAHAFGMEVVYTRARPGDVKLIYPARRVEIDDLFAGSRVVTLHCPLNDRTRGLVDLARLRRMPREAVLVNTARGEVVVERDLAHALREGWIAGAAIDTFGAHSQLIAVDSPLLGLENVILTPHTAGATAENLEYTFHRAGLENLAAWLAGRPLTGVVEP